MKNGEKMLIKFGKSVCLLLTDMAASIKLLACLSSVVFITTIGMYQSTLDMKRRRLSWRSFFGGEQGEKSMAIKQIEGPELRDFLRQEKNEDVAKLRILTLGASRTFGATLKDRFSSAYPYLLSPNATNLAIRATGPDYPSLCTFSMIGDEAQFDAIVLEFYIDADDHLIRLARRLRRRYPKAAIIVLRMWGPLQYTYLPTESPQGLRNFLDRHSLSIHDPGFIDVLKRESGPDDWLYDPLSPQMDVQQKVMDKSGAKLWELPRPKDFFEAIEQHRHFFAEDLVHISEVGHGIIAEGLRGILADVQRSDVSGPWAHDVCESWFESGVTTLQAHPEVVMTKFDKRAKKWAMELRPSADAWIIARNPLGRAAQVFVRYMKTTPPPGLYPTTRVVVDGGRNDIAILNPTGNSTHSRIHVNRVAKIGIIPPGDHKLVFTSLEEGKQFPFRVTGVVISPFDDELNRQ